MTGHVVSFEPAGAPTRAVCSQCGELTIAPACIASLESRLFTAAESHAHFERGTVEFAGLPPVERAS